MNRTRNRLNSAWIVILIVALVIPIGCGDDDNPVDPGAGTTYTSPTGKWQVTTTDSDVHVTSSTVLPQ